MPTKLLRPLNRSNSESRLVPTTVFIPQGTATRKVENLMVLSPQTPSLTKLLLKPGRWTIGSAATCSYQIVAEGVQPRHALLLCGGQTTLLKAWDAKTWHNGQAVRGEVRLQPDDRVTIGSVEFTVEQSGSFDVLSPLSDPQAELSVRQRSPIPATSQPDGFDLERLRRQIQELRDELSQRLIRRTEVVAAPPPLPVAETHPDVERLSNRVVELEQSAADARRVAEQTQLELSALRAEQERRDEEWTHERERLLAEIADRELAREKHEAAVAAEREQWQEELVSAANARRQLADESAQQQSALQTEAARWQKESEELRSELRQQQARWEAERTQLLEESQRKETIAQRDLQAAAQSQQVMAEQTRQLIADRQQIEADRQAVQAERQELERSIAESVAERHRLEEQAADVQSKVEDLTRRMSEFEQQQAQLTRDQQVLEHSWNWVQSDRRKLVEEKEQWQQKLADLQAERERWQSERDELQRALDELVTSREQSREERDAFEQFTAERDKFEIERTAWLRQRDQEAAEWQANAAELAAAHEELQTQQQAFHEEQARLQTLRADCIARAAEIQIERQSIETDRQSLSEERLAWENDRTARDADVPLVDQTPPDFDETPSQTLTGDWSIGVDLTAPRETLVAEQPIELGDNSDWSASTWSRPLADATSLAQLSTSEANSPATDWEDPPHSESLADFMESTEIQPSDAEDLPKLKGDDLSTMETDNPLRSFETLDPKAAALRRELAEKFQMPDLCKTLPDTQQEVSAPPPPLPDPSQPLPETCSADEPVVPPSSGPIVNALESLSFDDDEPVEDSVSRYMQHLLARSQPSAETADNRFNSGSRRRSPGTESQPRLAERTSEVLPIRATDTEVVAESASPVVEGDSIVEPIANRTDPVHRQDKTEIRATTEKLRQVANQQTLKNVQNSNWDRLKRSIKTKSCLAAFSFALSAGLLFLGYNYQPDFLVLGLCASGLGVMTWLDLFIAIRDARKRTAQLAGRKKKS